MPFQNHMVGFGAEEQATSGTLWAWGVNTTGEFGNGATSETAAPSPVQIGSDDDWNLVDGGHATTFFVRNNGEFWACGYGVTIPDGPGNPFPGHSFAFSSPIQIGSLTDWGTAYKQGMAGGHEHAFAIKKNGSLWGWGEKYLPIGDTITRNSPVQSIGADTDWYKVVSGKEHGMATRTDGTLWAWGKNTSGRLGDGTTIRRSSPVQIGTGTDWADFSCGSANGVAIKTDGTIWQWGSSDALGYGTGNQTYSSPVQIGSETYWESVSCGDDSVHAVTTGGKYFGWGRNSSGCLGIGHDNGIRSPVQVGSLTDWGTFYTYAGATSGSTVFNIKTDGTLWAIGYNAGGQLGIGDTIAASSPTQVGSETDWLIVNIAAHATKGIRET